MESRALAKMNEKRVCGKLNYAWGILSKGKIRSCVKIKLNYREVHRGCGHPLKSFVVYSNTWDTHSRCPGPMCVLYSLFRQLTAGIVTRTASFVLGLCRGLGSNPIAYYSSYIDRLTDVLFTGLRLF